MRRKGRKFHDLVLSQENVVVRRELPLSATCGKMINQLNLLRRADGVHLLPAVPQEDLHAVMKSCFALVNSSVSEGMSAAVLEAMDLRVPVLARNIPGNAAVIVHQTTGLLYSTPQEFVQLAQTLMKDPLLHREIVRKAREYILKHHSWEKERKVYQNLALNLHECSRLKQP